MPCFWVAQRFQRCDKAFLSCEGFSPWSTLLSDRRGFMRQLLVAKLHNLLNRALVRLKRIAVNGNRVHNFLQEFERRLDILMPVKRDKTAGKQFRNRLARRKPRDYVSVSVLKNKNPSQPRAVWRGIHSLPMPGSPIHPHLVSQIVIPNRAEGAVRNLLFASVTPNAAAHIHSVILSGVTGRQSRAVAKSKACPEPVEGDPMPTGSTTSLARNFHHGPVPIVRIPPRVIPPHNNPVIAQNLDFFERSPQPRSRTLPRPRMPHKQIPRPIRPNNPAPMQLNCLLLRKPVHDQEFVHGVGKRRDAIPKLRQKK